MNEYSCRKNLKKHTVSNRIPQRNEPLRTASRGRQWSNYQKISKGAHTIEVPKVRKRGTICRGGGVWGLLRTIGDSRNVELGRDKFGLEEYEGLRYNDLRAPKARRPSRLGGLGKRRKLPHRGLG